MPLAPPVPGKAAATRSTAAPLRPSRRWTLASASCTGTPSRRSSAAAVLLPMPIEPVRPRTIIAPSCEHGGAQLRRHLGLDAEPGGETGSCLVKQHAETVDRRVAAPPRGSEQRRFERAVDDIVDDPGNRQAVERQGRRPPTRHRPAPPLAPAAPLPHP